MGSWNLRINRIIKEVKSINIFERYVNRNDIYDGDTFTISSPINGRNRIRIADFNAPELNAWGGREAKTRLQSLIGNKVVIVKSKAIDKYNRIIADVFVNGMNIVQIL